MDTDNIITVLAILISPLLAIQATRFLDQQAEKRERREAIFRTLMSTRARNLDAEHVDALNSIDVEFTGSKKKDEKVRLAWKAYLSHLGTKGLSEEQWNTNRIDLFVELLYEIGLNVGYRFDKTRINEGFYSPEFHGNLEQDKIAIRMTDMTPTANP